MSRPQIFIVPVETRERMVAQIASYLMSVLPGKRIRVTVERYVKRRSDLQNKALWGCAYAHLKEETGNDPEDLHRYFCGEFFGWVDGELFGKRYRRPFRTTTTNEEGDRELITTIVFMEFYKFIQQRSAENGYFVPDPDPEWRERAEEEMEKERKAELEKQAA